MHAQTLLFWPSLLLLSLCGIVSAPPPLTLPTDAGLALTQSFNSTGLPHSNLTATTALAGLRTPTCYTQGHRSPPVDVLACFEIMSTLARTRGYEKRILWRRNPRRGQAVNVKMGACRLQVIDGADDDHFSVADVVDVMEVVLNECQPDVRPEYAGTGGQMGVGRYGFVVRVIGVAGKGEER